MKKNAKSSKPDESSSQRNGKPSKPSAELVLLGEDHSGRDEMNLAGNPFALLAAATKNGQTFLHREFERRLPSGKIITASWVVNGDAQLGLPGPNETLLYLVLMQLTREAGEATGEEQWPQVVHFSKLDVMKRLGWHNNAGNYQLLHDCFARLQAVSIRANHSFYNARTGVPYDSVGFAILDNFALAPDKPGLKAKNHTPQSWFKWNDVIHASFCAGNVRSLALDFTLSLDSPTAQRLFRLLENFRCSQKPPRRDFAIDLFQLRDRLGMTPYKFPSKIKEKLAGAVQELSARGYLESVEWLPSQKGAEMAVFRFKTSNPSQVTRLVSQGQKAALAGQETALAIEVGESKQEFAHRMAQIYADWPESQRLALRDQARQNVEPIFWDRLENPDSPMSLALWELVARFDPQNACT